MRKNILVFLGIVIVCVGVVLLWPQRQNPTEVGQNENIDSAASAVQNTLKMQDAETLTVPIIRYGAENVFNPLSVQVEQKQQTGGACVITIANDSAAPLNVRVGPYTPGTEKGFLYNAIESGKSLTIDPRYGSLTEISFYSKEKPEAIFTAHIGPTCLP